MLYRYRRGREMRRFDQQVRAVLHTTPITLRDAPCSIVTLLAYREGPALDHNLMMYLLAIKSFYPKLGRGKVVVILGRDTPPRVRDTLSHHLVGVEFVLQEDIPTDPCQRGGTWERLLFCLDRSQSDYVIQMDSDVLAVGRDVDEVVRCVQANRAFTMSDGFALLSLPDAAAQAQATPGDYIGIATERCFDRYPDAARHRYVRGSSGFTGFARGGYTRAGITAFHQAMEALVGERRWREWGTEQCGSNFAVSNSPDPVVLPYPEYASFTRHVWRSRAKLLHFIGRFRFMDEYFATRGQEVIAALTPGAVPPRPPDTENKRNVAAPTGLLRSLTPGSAAAYLRWRLLGRAGPLTLHPRVRHEFQQHQAFSPKVLARPGQPGDVRAIGRVFGGNLLVPPAWIPQERVLRVVDVGAEAGTAAAWWLATYPRTRLLACTSSPADAALLHANLEANVAAGRAEARATELGSAEGRGRLLSDLAGPRIDILRLGRDALGLLAEPGFAVLDVHAVVLDGGGRDAAARLGAAGYETYDLPEAGVVWGYGRRAPALLRHDGHPGAS